MTIHDLAESLAVEHALYLRSRGVGAEEIWQSVGMEMPVRAGWDETITLLALLWMRHPNEERKLAA